MMSLSVGALFTYFCPEITDDQFNAFHSMERQLYSRLIFDLGRDPEQSMQVMGFWMWLELVICNKMDLVIHLLKLPIAVLNEVADESVVCLKCIGSEILPFRDGVFQLVLLRQLVRENISLELLHEYRFTVINGVRRRVKDVCVRAFKDILEKIDNEKFPGGSGRRHSILTTASAGEVGWSHDCGISNSFARAIINKTRSCNVDKEGNRNLMAADGNKRTCPFNGDGRNLPAANGQKNCYRIGNESTSFSTNTGDRQISTTFGNKSSCFIGGVNSLKAKHVIQFPYNAPVISFPIFPPAQGFYPIPPGGALNIQQILPAENVQACSEAQKEFHSWELSDKFGCLSVTGNLDNVLPEDRTIFLTFSRGYPISELELRNYFTRKFGDFIEAIYMQEVAPGGQPLFARVVSRSAIVVDVVVAGGKAKYSINGRQVWAKKYKKKHT